MEHVAIDLGARQSQVCIRAEDGRILMEKRLFTAEISTFLADRPKSRLIIETCAESFRIADAALLIGHEVRVVPSTLALSLGVGARRTKTDQRDARALSEVSCRVDLPSVHIPSASSRERKALCGMREGLVEARTKLINTIRGWLRTQGVTIRVCGSTKAFPAQVRAAFAAVPAFVERQLRALEALSREIREADQEIASIAKADPTTKRLMTVPGVGPVTSMRFAAAIDDVSRFKNAHRIHSYVGLTPGEDSSSERKRRTGITKAGPTRLRWALVQAAWCARRTRPHDPMVVWAIEIEKRRGKKIAATALARKIAGILYALWRDETIYTPKLAARS